MKNIVFIAPPAAGKGTQSKMICAAYNVPHISTGDLLREAVESGTTIGNQIKNQMTLGTLIDDEVVLTLLKERLAKEDCKDGYILDGYPRNVAQAKVYDALLAESGKKVEHVLVLDLDYDTAKMRITGRFTCQRCGHVYNTNIEELKPMKQGVCDYCKSKLIQRKDDNEETFKKRYETYLKETEPLIAYYKEKDIVSHINSKRDAYLIFADIKKILGEPKHD
ncbi:MAG: adenylate kinase [Bacilli bacterium]|nr:adenylate kinase [Bacilli bacterium]